MTEALYTWLGNLVCYFILLCAVMNFLPDNSYKKYIQYYMGLLLILVILSPVFQITSMQEQIDSYIAQFEEQTEEREIWEQKAKSWQEKWAEDTERIQGQEVIP